ncbi:hypothetical protein [Leminorella grimontii]|uniref:hypothetical protein n=1 Tax=Leminorella grimontii TaxID=82981 RepID=UPI00321F6A6D
MFSLVQSRIRSGFFSYQTAARALCALLLFGSSTVSAESRQTLTFDEFYSKVGVLGLEFSDRVKSLAGKEIEITGFMAPPLKAESQFFVLTKMPMAMCPFCSSDADWPEDILVVYLSQRQTFVQNNAMIKVTGVLEYGSWRDPQTGFVSQLRLREAGFSSL